MELLIGTASQGTIEELSNRIENMENSNQLTRHILEQAITAINWTHLQTVKNKESINNMINVAEELFMQIHNTSSYLSHTLSPLVQFVAHYVQVQELLERSRFYVTRLEQEYNNRVREIAELTNGHLPMSVIRPEHLKEVLNGIKKLLPSHLNLPLNCDTHLATYYQIIKTTLVSKANGMLGIAVFPLIESSFKYEVYSAHSIETQYVDKNKNVQLTAEYNLDTKHFIVSTDLTKYSIVDENIFSICAFEHLDFCPLKTPIYSSAAAHDSCVVNLFLNEENKNEICDVKVKHKNNHFPKVIQIRGGDWLVLCKNPEIFAIYCLMKDVTYVEINPPLQHLKLNPSCHAVNQYVTIPATFTDITHIKIPPNHFNFTVKNKFWKPIIKSLKLNDPVVPPRVKSIANVGELLSHLKKEINTSIPDNVFSPWKDVTKQVIISIITTFIIIVVVEAVIFCGVIKKCKQKCFKKGPKRPDPNPEGELAHMINNTSVKMSSEPSTSELSTDQMDQKRSPNYNIV